MKNELAKLAMIIAGFVVVKALKCSWEAGIKGNGKMLFVTPPIDGWSLLSGWSLPIRNQIEYEQFLNDLSTEFGESQYFANHGGSSSAAWLKGRLKRAVAKRAIDLQLNYCNLPLPSFVSKTVPDRTDATTTTRRLRET